MGLVARTVVGRVEILEDGQIQVRTDTVIEQDGVELARTYHRHVETPRTDPATADARVTAVAAAVWTSDIVAAFDTKQRESAEFDTIKAKRS